VVHCNDHGENSLAEQRLKSVIAGFAKNHRGKPFSVAAGGVDVPLDLKKEGTELLSALLSP
jgi:hypothetical protein